jgi:potassium-transporting ATPase KdpC subunit
MLRQLVPALRMTIFLTIVTGLIYPGVITSLCQVLFPHQANGSLLTVNSKLVGSELIGQNFHKPEYFHPRPSAAGNDGYDAAASSGSNLGPTSQKLFDRVKASADDYRKENPAFHGAVPADALTASASGLDPEISLANATAQADRVAQARGKDVAEVQKLIDSLASHRDLGLLGEARVNVLKLNLALDREMAKE